MPYSLIDNFSIHQKGKYVRFRTSYIGHNLTHGFNISKTNDMIVKIAPGAVGLIYEVRGGTMFIGFSKDLKTPPPKHYSPTQFSATIQVHISDINKLEIES